jgi:hypothetical protein
MRVAWRAVLAAAAALTLHATMSGCEGPAFLAETAGLGGKVKPVYDLQDRTTLVMVDDPQNRLGSPVLQTVIATNVAHHLKKNGVLSGKVIAGKEQAELAARLGPDKYARTPIAKVGRELGAEQVVYVEVEDVILQPAPGIYRPAATLEVKVMDVASNSRLYPEPPPIDEPTAPKRGRSLNVQMRYDKKVRAESRGLDAQMARSLAERIGLEVARLFYEYKPEPAFDGRS